MMKNCSGVEIIPHGNNRIILIQYEDSSEGFSLEETFDNTKAYGYIWIYVLKDESYTRMPFGIPYRLGVWSQKEYEEFMEDNNSSSNWKEDYILG